MSTSSAPSTNITTPDDQSSPRSRSGRLVRVLIIGAGSRGQAYAKSIQKNSAKELEGTESYIPAIVSGVCEPRVFNRAEFANAFLGKDANEGENVFASWTDWVAYESERRERERKGENVPPGVDAVFICVLDTQHVSTIEGVMKLGGLHVICEKPLATSLDECTRTWDAVREEEKRSQAKKVMGICHVLRYSPHNMMLRRLVRKQEVIGEVLGMEHTEPVGWWHFSHSYVRGNWRKESTTAPSLLTKSCHDVDFLAWMLCSPTDADSDVPPHLPASITSTGSLKYLRKAMKPTAAGDATNCLSCPIESDCIWSAKKIYKERHLDQGKANWPVDIVNPEMEDCLRTQGADQASELLLKALAEDYTPDTPGDVVASRNWFGRCVWESDNDVCDDQHVTLTWDDDPLPSIGLKDRIAKTASMHMIAYTEKQCERRGRVYGTKGEIEYDSDTIRVFDFATGQCKVYYPKHEGGGHGGGDNGLARQFCQSVDAVINHGVAADLAQRKFLGCSLEEVIRSHVMVFAAEDARKERKVIDWDDWWQKQVEGRLRSH